MLTVEATLGNSLWVMLKPEKQMELQEKLERIPRPMQGLTTPQCICDLTNEDWNCYYRKSGDDKYAWHWDTFPHPSSWPKEHELNAKHFIGLKYDEDLRNYEVTKVYGKRMDSHGRAYYTEVHIWCLLVFSNLTLNFGGKVSEAGKDQLISGALGHKGHLESLVRLTEGSPRLNALNRKAHGALREIERLATMVGVPKG